MFRNFIILDLRNSKTDNNTFRNFIIIDNIDFKADNNVKKKGEAQHCRI